MIKSDYAGIDIKLIKWGKNPTDKLEDASPVAAIGYDLIDAGKNLNYLSAIINDNIKTQIANHYNVTPYELPKKIKLSFEQVFSIKKEIQLAASWVSVVKKRDDINTYVNENLDKIMSKYLK